MLYMISFRKNEKYIYFFMTKLILSIFFAWFCVLVILIVFWCAFLVFLLQILDKIFWLLSFDFWLIKLTLIVTVLFLNKLSFAKYRCYGIFFDTIYKMKNSEMGSNKPI